GEAPREPRPRPLATGHRVGVAHGGAARPLGSIYREAPPLVDVAGVTAAGDVEAAGRAAPGGAVDEADVRGPAHRAAVVVVAVVRGGAALGAAGADPHLIPLPVVGMKAQVSRQGAEGRRVLVIEPELDVEVTRPLAGAVEAATL